MITKRYMRYNWATGKALYIRFKGEEQYQFIGNVYGVSVHDGVLFFQRLNPSYYAGLADDAEIDYQKWLGDLEFFDMADITAFRC